MGNEVYFGAPFATIARKHSQEPNAQKGGYYDWTSQGSLASKPINQAIFTLEAGKLSQIIEDDRGCHIVRVIERTDGRAGAVPGGPDQNQGSDHRSRSARPTTRSSSTQLGTEHEVWTIYDDATALARQPGAVQR